MQNTTSYILAFEAVQAQTPGNHSIEVRVRREGAQVFARRGYIVPETTDAPEASAAATTRDPASLLREVAMGTVPQGQLTMQVQVVPEFAVGREGRAVVTVQMDAASAGDAPVDLVVLTIDDAGKIGSQQGFRMTPPESGASATRTLTTVLPIARGAHQLRVAAATADGTRSGLVITPVEIIEPRKDLVMAPPVLLGGSAAADVAPTLTRTFRRGYAPRPAGGRGRTSRARQARDRRRHATGRRGSDRP